MKKIILVMLSAFICISSSFCYTNIISLGVKGFIPSKITGTTTEYDTNPTPETATFSFDAIGLNLGYIGCFDNGFTFKDNTSVGFGLGKTSCKAMDVYNGSQNLFNIGITELVGIGYNFVNNDKLFVALYGNIGLDLNIALTGATIGDKVYATTVISPAFLLGGDFTFVFTPKKVFSIYASISANYAYSLIPAVTAYTTMSTKIPNTSYNRVFSTQAYFKAVPTIGISWKF